MPEIKDSSEIENFFMEKLREQYSKERSEIHVSDLVYCLRKPFFRRLVNHELSTRQLVYFLDGARRHEGLQGLVPECEPEKEVRKYGVVGHIDLSKGVPIEIKTTRAKSTVTIPPHYIVQGAYYCVLTGVDRFILIIQHINDGVITFKEIKFSSEEMEQYKKKLLEDKKKLKRVLSNIEKVKDSSRDEIVKFLEDNGLRLASVGLKWMCVSCEYRNICLPVSNGNV